MWGAQGIKADCMPLGVLSASRLSPSLSVFLFVRPPKRTLYDVFAWPFIFVFRNLCSHSSRRAIPISISFRTRIHAIKQPATLCCWLLGERYHAGH
jgi:hypothetical protein